MYGGMPIGLLWLATPHVSDSKIMRTKTSRVKADQRALETALMQYYVDHGRYPTRIEALEDFTHKDVFSVAEALGVAM